MIHSNRINKKTNYHKARFYSKNKNLEIKLFMLKKSLSVHHFQISKVVVAMICDYVSDIIEK